MYSLIYHQSNDDKMPLGIVILTPTGIQFSLRDDVDTCLDDKRIGMAARALCRRLTIFNPQTDTELRYFADMEPNEVRLSYPRNV